MRKKIKNKIRTTTWISLILLVVFLPLVFYLTFLKPKDTEAVWFNESWSYRKKITIDETKVAGSSDFTNFPMLYSVTDTNLSSFAQTDGDDIVFTDLNGRKLDHEIESYTSGTGALVAWVNIPTLYAARNTTIYMYYGNAGAANQQSKQNTWNSNYQAAWHMGESSGERYDSSDNANTLTDVNTVVSGTGKIGTGADIEKDTTEKFTRTDATQKGLDLSGTYTVNFWVKFETLAAASAGLLGKHTATQGWDIFYNFDGTRDTWIVDHDDTQIGYNASGQTTATWYMVTAIFDDTNNEMIICQNASCDAADALSVTPTDHASDLQIGYSEDMADYLDGVIDEVWIMNAEMSTDWVTTVYNNHNSPSTFVATATAEQSIGPISYWRLDEGVDNTCSGGTNDVCNAVSGGTDGAKTNATWATEELCLSGKCLKFDGDGDYVDFGDAYDMGTSDMTLSLWFRTADTEFTLISKSRYSADDYRYSVIYESGVGIYAHLDSGSEYQTTPAITTVSDNKWHLATAVYDRDGSLTLYIDGVSKGTIDISSESADNVTSAYNLYLGVYNDATGTAPHTTVGEYQGFIDEVKIYKYARTAAQIKTDFASKDGSTKGISASIGDYNQKSLSDGLAGYWKMDETSWTGDCSTTSVTDSSGNGNNGKACPNASATSPNTGKFGNAGSFDGTNDYIDLGTPSSVHLQSSMSFSFWVYASNLSNTKALINRGVHPSISDGFDLITENDSSFQFKLKSGGTTSTLSSGASTITANSWYHISATWDANTKLQSVYVNGRLMNQQSTTFSSLGDYSARTLYICNNGNDNNCIGKMDDVRIYNRALSPAEIRQLYSWAPGPIGYWPMDEGSWNATSGEVKDVSGNANNGTAQSGAIPYPSKFGNGGKFDGSDDYISVATATTFDVTTFTVEAWVKPSTVAAFQDVIARRTGEECYSISIDASAKIDFRLGNTTCESHAGATSLTANTWYHIALTYDENTDGGLIYLNGVKDGSFTDTDGPNAMTAAIAIGAHTGGGSNRFTGLIDEVKIYNYIRTPAQVMEDLNAGHPLGGSSVSSQLVYWNFDEGYSTTANNKGTASSSNGTLTSIASPATSTSGWTASGKVNKAIVFDGSDDKVVLATASDAAVDFNGSESFTISTWIYPTTVPTSTTEEDMIVGKWDQTSSLRTYRMFLENDDTDSTGRISVEIYDESADQTISATSANDSISENTWYHLSLTFNGGAAGAAGDLKLYLNGKQVASNSANTFFLGLEDLGSDFTVGDYDATDGTAALTAFTGRIDEVKVYSGVLSIDNIQVDMNTGSSMAVLPAQSSVNESSYITDGAGNPPVGYWNFDENTDNTCSGGTNDLCDRSGNANDGVNTNMESIDWVPGKIGSALDFDGSNEVVSISDNATLDPSDEMTVEAWFQIDQTASTKGEDMRIVRKSDSSVVGLSYVIEILSSNNTIQAKWSNTTPTAYAATTTTAITTLNTWYHVVMVKTGTTIKIYLNGKDDTASSDTTTGTHLNGDGALTIGASSTSSRRLDGRIDEVKLYDYARTQAQIAYDYNRGFPTGWWKLDECEGTTAYDSGSMGNNGTINIGSGGGNTSAGTCTSGTSTHAWNNGVTGKRNSSLDFDNNDDYITVSSPDLPTGDFSYTMWVNLDADASTDTLILVNDNTATDWDEIRILIDDGVDPQTVQVKINDSLELTTTQLVPDATWTHIAVTRAGSAIKAYINGRLDPTTGTDSTTLNFSTCALVIGANPTNGCTGSLLNLLSGKIDDVRVYNYALSANQVRQIVGEGAARFGPETGQP